MTIRFAAPSPASRLRTRPSSTRLAFPQPANDDGGLALGDTKLTSALRHFAAHGLDAAPNAFARAQEAHAAGDEEGFVHWRDICHALDRRLARQLPSTHNIARPA